MVEAAVLYGVITSCVFIVLNVAMNLYMKWLFSPSGGDFALPWTMLAVQQLQSYMVLQPLMAYRGTRSWGWDITPPPGDNNGDEGSMELGWVGMLQVLAVTVLFCLNVGLNGLSLVRISITLNQTVRAFLPVGVLVLASCLEGRAYPSHSYITTAILVMGIILTCWGSPDFELQGFCLAFGSTMVAALGASLNGRLLNKGPFSNSGPEKIMQLTMLQTVPAFFICSFVATVVEGAELSRLLSEPDARWSPLQRLGLVSISSMLALMANLGRCGLVAATSALMETLAGNFKVALLCLIDHWLFHTSLYFHNYVGVFCTFLGFSGHVLLSYALALIQQVNGEDEEEDGELQTIPEEDARVVEVGPGKESTDDTGRPRAASTTSSRGRRSRVDSMEIPQMMSGGETGLAAEMMGVQMGRKSLVKPRKQTHLTTIDEGQESARARAATWAPGQAEARIKKTWLTEKLGEEVSSLWQAPEWLTDTTQAPEWLSNVTDSTQAESWSPAALAVLDEDRQFNQDRQAFLQSNGRGRPGRAPDKQPGISKENSRTRIWTVG
jgi:hypothetical protein